ncbi:hypothetical protein A4X13_0g8043 [Tilletia indica]|uniref:Reverse transcriptase RNase H-like domain-containing protein n=1 Tax=Tilletia indica TaxID=43049 RepID=A0A177T6I2_9BASI|nr:hypothetical protein A4X13_0g8043 [Tilletia indica]
MANELASRKLRPFRVREVLGDHRVRLDVPDDLRIGDTFSAGHSFATHRTRLFSSSDAAAQSHIPPSRVPSPPSLPPRARRAPVVLRGYETASALVLSAALYKELRGPYHRPRKVVLKERSLLLTEKPVAFLSRLTMPSEPKLAAAELELCCLAWAFGRFLHLLEGADVTVVTDLGPLGPMLTIIFDAAVPAIQQVPGPSFARGSGLSSIQSEFSSFVPPLSLRERGAANIGYGLLAKVGAQDLHVRAWAKKLLWYAACAVALDLFGRAWKEHFEAVVVAISDQSRHR